MVIKKLTDEDAAIEVRRLAINYRMTEPEALAYTYREFSCNAAANEISRHMKKLISPQNANTYRQRALVKADAVELDIIEEDGEGNELRYYVHIDKNSQSFITIHANRETAITHANEIWNSLKESEKKRTLVRVQFGWFVMDGEKIGEFHYHTGIGFPMDENIVYDPSEPLPCKGHNLNLS